MSTLRAAWKDDVRAAVDPLRGDVRRLTDQVARLNETLARTLATLDEVQRSAEQTRLVLRLNQRQQADVDRLPQVLDVVRVEAFIRHAIAGATLHDDPFPHVLIEPLLPDDVYKAVLRAIPAVAFFDTRDRVKQNLRVPFEFAPALSEAVWRFVDDVIARNILRSAVLEKFRQPLLRQCAALFGESFSERAAALPQAHSGGRLMLRRPGYFLAPHRDPKRAMFTCLLYLARPGDNEEYGTTLYRVPEDAEPTFVETFYPGEHGLATEPVKTVPYRPNSMLVFLNSGGAHGARIPDDAPASIERYAFQFYIGPEASALDALIAGLPSERLAKWARKKHRL
jgi:hypothetical protein